MFPENTYNSLSEIGGWEIEYFRIIMMLKKILWRDAQDNFWNSFMICRSSVLSDLRNFLLAGMLKEKTLD